MLTAELLLRWKGAFQVALPVLLAMDMVHSIYYVAGLYQDRLEVRAEVLFLACESSKKLHLVSSTTCTVTGLEKRGFCRDKLRSASCHATCAVPLPGQGSAYLAKSSHYSL